MRGLLVIQVLRGVRARGEARGPIHARGPLLLLLLLLVLHARARHSRDRRL